MSQRSWRSIPRTAATGYLNESSHDPKVIGLGASAIYAIKFALSTLTKLTLLPGLVVGVAAFRPRPEALSCGRRLAAQCEQFGDDGVALLLGLVYACECR